MFKEAWVRESSAFLKTFFLITPVKLVFLHLNWNHEIKEQDYNSVTVFTEISEYGFHRALSQFKHIKQN